MRVFRDKYGGWRPGSFIAAGVLTVVTLIGSCDKIVNNYEYSRGVRTGMVNKVAKKGIVWKTYEGQMALEGIVSSGSSSGANIWDFSLDRQARHGENTEALIKKLQDALESGTKVKLTYIEPLYVWSWRSGTGYHVQSVEPVEKKE